MSSLYEITKAQKDLELAVSRGDFTDEQIKDTMDDLQGDLSSKITDYCHVHRNLNEKLSAIKEEINRLNSLKKSCESQINNLERSMLYGLEVSGQKSIDVGIFKVSTRKSTSIQIDSDKDIPDEFIETSISYKANKSQLKKYLSTEGNEINGVSLKTTTNLNIK